MKSPRTKIFQSSTAASGQLHRFVHLTYWIIFFLLDSLHLIGTMRCLYRRRLFVDLKATFNSVNRTILVDSLSLKCNVRIHFPSLVSVYGQSKPISCSRRFFAQVHHKKCLSVVHLFIFCFQGGFQLFLDGVAILGMPFKPRNCP